MNTTLYIYTLKQPYSSKIYPQNLPFQNDPFLFRVISISAHFDFGENLKKEKKKKKNTFPKEFFN